MTCPGQVFELTDDLPGRRDVGLHDLARTVTTVEVRLCPA